MYPEWGGFYELNRDGCEERLTIKKGEDCASPFLFFAHVLFRGIFAVGSSVSERL